MLAERDSDGQSYHPGPLTHGGEVRALGQRQTNHQPDDDQHGADQKRQAPSPRQELLVGQLRNDIERQRRRRGAGGGTHLREGPVETVPRRGRMFDGHQGGSAPLATDGETLHQPQQRQQYWGGHADLRIGG